MEFILKLWINFEDMDFGTWIWLAIAIIALISRLKKKPKKPVETTNPPPITGEINTFEELLKEIQEAKTTTKAEVPVNKKEEGSYASPEKDIWHKKRDWEESDTDYEPKKVYTVAPEAVFDKQVEDKRANFAKNKVRLSRNQKTLQMGKNKHPFGFLKDLKSNEGLKKAFVLSEVLRRKY